MNLRKAHRLLAINLAHTYVQLAKGVPGTEILRGSRWVAATNPFPHPICNFAVCENAEDLEAAEIYRLATGRRYFNVYICTAPEDSLNDSGLLRWNFRSVYKLSEMAFDGPLIGKPAELVKVEDRVSRKRLCDFMSWQFFSTQSPPVREKISQATAEALELVGYELSTSANRSLAAGYPPARPIGAVMLSSTEGMLGLYNLCVDLEMRSRGLGSSIVFAVQTLARRESVIVGLQCDPKLAAWYSSLGFKEVGSVGIFGLDLGVKL